MLLVQNIESLLLIGGQKRVELWLVGGSYSGSSVFPVLAGWERVVWFGGFTYSAVWPPLLAPGFPLLAQLSSVTKLFFWKKRMTNNTISLQQSSWLKAAFLQLFWKKWTVDRSFDQSEWRCGHHNNWLVPGVVFHFLPVVLVGCYVPHGPGQRTVMVRKLLTVMSTRLTNINRAIDVKNFRTSSWARGGWQSARSQPGPLSEQQGRSRMSGGRGPGPLPPRWLKCPRKSATLIGNRSVVSEWEHNMPGCPGRLEQARDWISSCSDTSGNIKWLLLRNIPTIISCYVERIKLNVMV